MVNETIKQLIDMLRQLEYKKFEIVEELNNESFVKIIKNYNFIRVWIRLGYVDAFNLVARGREIEEFSINKRLITLDEVKSIMQNLVNKYR